MSNLRFLTLVCAIGTLAGTAWADDKDIDVSKLPPASTKTGVTYAADIQPLFQPACFPCHGPKTPKPKGGLRVDSLELILKGGEDGAAVTPGNSAKSPLLANIAHLGDPDDYMPPPKNKGNIPPLTPAQIGLVRAWVDQGAK
jgi:hypothetical protein